MTKWYYVLGPERIGPVSEYELLTLFHKLEINLETYVWKKGFENWIRFKDVPELFLLHDQVEPKVQEAEIVKLKSPEIEFFFDWKKTKEDEDLFYIKIGSDRKLTSSETLFGPYSLREIKEALEEKRMNFQTLIFAPGMRGWTAIGDTPINPIHQVLNEEIAEDAPLMIAMTNSPLPILALVKSIDLNNVVLLGVSQFDIGNEVLCSLYEGRQLKATDLKLAIGQYRSKEQRIDCEILSINEDTKKMILHYAY